MKEVSETYQKLKAPFPIEAYSLDSSRGFELTSIKAQYVVERMNDVLGIHGWEIDGEFSEKEAGVLYIGKLKTFLENKDSDILEHEVQAIGFSPNKKNVGDAYKSAKTDALSKAASYLGVGDRAFKGLVNLDPLKDDQRKVIFALCEEKGVDPKNLSKIVQENYLIAIQQLKNIVVKGEENE